MQELINIAMTSMDKENIIGASLELSDREKYRKEEFRSSLVSRLLEVDTSEVNEFEKERLKIIIYESDLYNGTNRREIIGKHFTEIQNDADYFTSNALKAMTILSNIKK